MNLLERRLEILKAEAMGFSQGEAVKTISDKYDLPKSVLWYDYRTKPKWQTHIQGIDAENLRLTIHNRYEYCYKEASFLLLTTQNESVKLGALARMTDILNGHSQLLGSSKRTEGSQTEPFIIKMWRPDNADIPKQTE